MIDWTSERILALLEARAPEGQTLEFKSELPQQNDKARSDFLKDVSSLANANGGTILYGIAEKSAQADRLAAMNLANVDAEIRRLSQMIESGIEPRVGGLKFTSLSMPDGDVLALDIPKSFDSPHRCLFNGHSKFVQRNGTYNSELTYDQLRSAFERTSNRVERLRAQWAHDLTLNDVWQPLVSGPICIVRLSPMLAAENTQVVDPKLAHKHWSQLIFPSWGGGSPIFNYEGLVATHGGQDGEKLGLVQVRRNGSISAYETAAGLISDEHIIPSRRVGDFIIAASRKLVDFAATLGLAGTSILNVGLVRLDGYKFATREQYGFHSKRARNLDQILFPEFWIENLQEPPDFDELLRPGFDLLWQSYGWAECPEFNELGKWSSK